MKKSFLGVALFLVAVAAACGSPLDSTVIGLTKPEQQQSVKLAEHRHDLQMRRNKAQLDFQSQMNRMAEEEAGINLESQQLCFQFSKAHKLDQGANYVLDEWKGQLIKK